MASRRGFLQRHDLTHVAKDGENCFCTAARGSGRAGKHPCLQQQGTTIMHQHTKPTGASFALLAVLLILPICSLSMQGEGAAILPSQTTPVADAWRLVTELDVYRHDVVALAERVGDLREGQRSRMAQLRLEYDREKARLLDELATRYAQKVSETLDESQANRYAGVLAALKELARLTAEAREQFLDEIGADARQRAALDEIYIPTSDLSRFVDLSEQKRAELTRLHQQKDRKLANTLQQRLDRSRWSNAESWQEYRKKYRDVRQRAEKELREQRQALLTDEELRKLEKVEAAALTYRKQLQDARRQTYETLRVLLSDGGK